MNVLQIVPSKIIRAAIDGNYYVRGDIGRYFDSSEYMCLSVRMYLKTLIADNGDGNLDRACDKVTDAFNKIIESENTCTLGVYLKLTNRKYRNYNKRYGFYSNACFKMRLEWFENHIKELELKGL